MPPLNIDTSSYMNNDTARGVMNRSKLEVDYDTNITKLYQAICNCEWDIAIQTAKTSPKEAQTWVVRYYSNGQQEGGGGNKKREIMWRFLPIHSACARQPPASVISALLKAYPDGAACMDDQGMYALHYACGNQASREVIRLLLGAFSEGAKMTDPRNMLPIHYVACWGPSSVNIIDMLLVAHNRNVANAKDADGKTALDLAKEGDYKERDAVVAALNRWFDKQQTNNTNSTTRSSATSSPLQLKVDTNINNNSMVMAVVADNNNQEYYNNYKSEKENEQEEKAATIAANRTVTRLRQELNKLKTEKKQIEMDKAKERAASEKQLHSQIEELKVKLHDTTMELEDAKKQSEMLTAGMKEKEKLMQSTEKQVDEASQKLVDVEMEKNNLRQQLAKLDEEYGKYKKKADNMNDRLGSMSASLTSMMETQSKLVGRIQERDERLYSGSEFRRAKLQELLDFEMQMTTTIMCDDEIMSDGFANAFEQQMKEMDAIAAVIAAMRQ